MIPFRYPGDDYLVKQMKDLLGELPQEWQVQWECMKKEFNSALALNRGNYLAVLLETMTNF